MRTSSSNKKIKDKNLDELNTVMADINAIAQKEINNRKMLDKGKKYTRNKRKVKAARFEEEKRFDEIEKLSLEINSEMKEQQEVIRNIENKQHDSDEEFQYVKLQDYTKLLCEDD